MKPQGYIPDSASPSAHEGADLDVPLVLRVAAMLGATLLVCVVAMALLFHHFEHKYPGRTSEAAPTVRPVDLPPAPRLQMHPRLDLLAVRKAEDAHLKGYGWVDPQHQAARIPIDRAMTLWVKTYAATPPPAANAPAASPTELQMRQQKAEENPHVP